MQCALFSRSIPRIERAATYWIKIDQGIDDGQTVSPLEIVAECTVCLSAMAAIRRVLSPPPAATRAVKLRSNKLVSLLNHPQLPHVTSVVVRNSWEHFDERLDEYLADTPPGKRSVTELQVSSRVTQNGATIMRRFDPLTLTIQFRAQSICLRSCAEEIKHLSQTIETAYLQLQKESLS